MPRNHDSSSPPPYEVNDLDQLLAGLSIAESTPPPTDITTLPHQSAASAPSTPARPSPLYSYSTPTRTGFTSSWCCSSSSCIHPLLTSRLRSEASALTQGVSGATPRRLTPKGKKKNNFQAYAVFCGRQIGAFRDWYCIIYLLRFLLIFFLAQAH